MAEYPKVGTSPIRCGRTRCKWRGYETDLKEATSTIGGLSCSVCPTCGYDSYSFMTPGEIKAWEQAQSAAAHTGE